MPEIAKEAADEREMLNPIAGGPDIPAVIRAEIPKPRETEDQQCEYGERRQIHGCGPSGCALAAYAFYFEPVVTEDFFEAPHPGLLRRPAYIQRPRITHALQNSRSGGGCACSRWLGSSARTSYRINLFTKKSVRSRR